MAAGPGSRPTEHQTPAPRPLIVRPGQRQGTALVEFPLAVKQNGSQSATAKRCPALSSRRQNLIDQPIVRCVEWIDESNPRQFKAILQVLSDQMTNAGPLCRAPCSSCRQAKEAQGQGQPRECAGQYRARKPPGAALAQRETRFATRSVFPFVPIQHCQKRWKRLRARSPGPAQTRKPKSSRAASPKRRSICAACGTHAISSCLIL